MTVHQFKRTPIPPAVSSRWVPGAREHRTSDGEFESVNSYDYSDDAGKIQQALLYDRRRNGQKKPKASLLTRLYGLAVVLSVGYYVLKAFQ